MSTQIILSFRTSTYARNIYLYGTNRLTVRDGFVGVPTEYYTPIEEYAKTTFSVEQIDNALTMGWLSQIEYDETIGE